MERGYLRLRDGGRVLIALPPLGSPAANALQGCIYKPAPDAVGILPLQTPDGELVDIPARDVTGLEVDPPYHLIRDFLTEEEAERTMAHALAHEAEFQEATLSLANDDKKWETPDYRFRRSRILNNVADVVPMVVNRLQTVLPGLWQTLCLHPRPIRNIECQITAHGDGDFFNTHTDNGLPDIAHRWISYVYYFHREPKVFTGGTLSIYRTIIENGVSSCGERVADIEPPRNSLMIFPSHIQHEVTPIKCPSVALADQRLTLNGWLVP